MSIGIVNVAIWWREDAALVILRNLGRRYSLRSHVTLLVALMAVPASEVSAQRAVAVDRVDSERSATSEWWRDMRRAGSNEITAAQEALRRYLAEPQRDVRGGKSDEWWQQGARQSVNAKFCDYILQMVSVLAAPGDYDRAKERPRHILIQGICKEALSHIGPRIERELVTIADGGDCFFEARYDLRSDKIVRFRANGLG